MAGGGRGGANVADGPADHRAHRGLVEGLQTGLGECGSQELMPRGDPDTGGVRDADTGGKDCDRAADVVHRLPQPVRDRAGLRGVQQQPRWSDGVALVLVVLARTSIVPRADGPDQGAQKQNRQPAGCRGKRGGLQRGPW